MTEEIILLGTLKDVCGVCEHAAALHVDSGSCAAPGCGCRVFAKPAITVSDGELVARSYAPPALKMMVEVANRMRKAISHIRISLSVRPYIVGRDPGDECRCPACRGAM